MARKSLGDYQFDSKTATVFTSAAFSKIWAEVYGLKWHSTGFRNDLGIIYSVTKKLSLLDYELSPYGLYWGSNELTSTSYHSAIEIVKGLSLNWKCQSITWNFRYDAYEQMKSALKELNPAYCSVTQSYTHILPIAGASYEQLVRQRIKPVTRRQVTQGRSRGLEIRKISTDADLLQHEKMYRSWVSHKGINPKPILLFKKLVVEMDNSVSLLGAYIQGELISAILIFKEPKEWFYWHGIRDMDKDVYFATDVLLSNTISEACETNIGYFNMGGSNGIPSLEFFKERWGAEKRPVWHLRWTNPFWKSSKRLWQTIRSVTKGQFYA